MFVYKFFGKNHEFEVAEESNLVFYGICGKMPQIKGLKNPSNSLIIHHLFL